jgi:hypothetical protein
MKKLLVFGAFRFPEFRIRDCVPVLTFGVFDNTGAGLAQSV